MVAGKGGAGRVGVEAPMTLKPESVLWDYLKCGNGSLMTSGTFKIVAKISGLMLQELSVLILLSGREDAAGHSLCHI